MIKLFLTIISAFLVGVFCFAIYNNWIIFRYPSYKSEVKAFVSRIKVDKKQVELVYWHNKKWNKEKISMLWTADKAANIQYLVNNWLNLLDEEQVMNKKVSLQTVLMASCNNKAYLSFDRNPFGQNSSTHKKLMWVESLLKTLRENEVALQSVYFLVHHQIMQDYNLDFSKPWPIYGFLNS